MFEDEDAWVQLLSEVPVSQAFCVAHGVVYWHENDEQFDKVKLEAALAYKVSGTLHYYVGAFGNDFPSYHRNLRLAIHVRDCVLLCTVLQLRGKNVRLTLS